MVRAVHARWVVGRISGVSSPTIPFREAARFWIRLGFVNFGGPSGQIALMHEELVERRGWIEEGRFLHALGFCMVLPGPEAQQLAIYIGWLLHRTIGGLIAGIGFVAPSAVLMLILSWVYAVHGDVTWVSGVFGGLAAGVLGMVVAAVLRLGGRAFGTPTALAIAAGSFVAIFLLGVPFPLVVVVAGVCGAVADRVWPGSILAPAEVGHSPDETPVSVALEAPHTKPSSRRAMRVLVVGLLAWWVPLLAVIAWRGPGDTLTTEALFFSGAAVVTFGGAYAVLAFVSQAAIVRFGWLSPSDVVTGLGLAESTPGPLIMVLEFVGFLAAYRFPGDLPPLVAGVLGAAVTVWATFAPCFLWIFLGAPYVERLRGDRRLGAALGAITAAVVGVIASLALTFGVHVLFDRVRTVEPLGSPVPLPDAGTLDVVALAIAVASFVAIFTFRRNPALVALACGLAGLLRTIVT
jgi:chromate transporter